MQPWVLSDGTEVRLGGVVTGNSACAQRLREDVTRVQEGATVTVQAGPPPGDSSALDLGNAELVDAWLRLLALRFGVPIVSEPELNRGTHASQSVPGRVY